MDPYPDPEMKLNLDPSKLVTQIEVTTSLENILF